MRNSGASVILAVAGAVAFCNSFDGVFLFDDHPNIVTNRSIRSLVPLTQARAVGRFTFTVNYAVGGLTPFRYHLVNLAIYLGAGCLLFRVIRRAVGTGPAQLRPATWHLRSRCFGSYIPFRRGVSHMPSSVWRRWTLCFIWRAFTACCEAGIRLVPPSGTR